MDHLIAISPQPKHDAVRRASDPPPSPRISHAKLLDPKELRQINEFSSAYEKYRKKGIAYAFALIFFSLSCLVFFISGLNVVVIFSAGALIMVINLIQCAREFFKEEACARYAYYEYLDNYPPRILRHLRDTASMSDWTKFEIDNYLEFKSQSTGSRSR